jgi:signal transduction histidine kinase
MAGGLGQHGGPVGDGRRRLWWALTWVGAVLALGLLQSLYFHLSFLLRGKAAPFVYPFVGTMTWSVTGGVLFFGVRWLVRRYPLRRPTWLRRLPLYVGALLLYGITQTTLMWASRVFLYWLFGLGKHSQGNMPLAYAMEFPIQVTVFTVMVGILHAVGALNEARERELRTAHLERSLARAELRNLRLQLQPHFLFNALNTISSTMYRDPAAADEVLSQLAELLRASLRTAHTDEVSLADELTTLACYCGIMRARFGQRLGISIAAEPEVGQALVPSMILQPLVENAIRHGNAERTGKARITVRAYARGQQLMLEVEDDGPGTSEGGVAANGGTGLSVTAERLQLLYGQDQRFEARNQPGGGFLVRVALPLRLGEHTEVPCGS